MSDGCRDLAQAVKPLLQGRNLGISLGQQRILDGVDLDLYAGDVVLLRGANGCGKTTLLNLLTGHLQPDSGSLSLHSAGFDMCWHFPRSPLHQWHPRKSFNAGVLARHGIARVWQDLRLFNNLTIMDNVAVALAGQRGAGPGAAMFRRGLLRQQNSLSEDAAKLLLTQTGIAHLLHASAGEVSLGQAKRTAIARALAGQAPVLFLDEPLAGLDRSGCEAVAQLLRELLERRRITLLMIEHPCNADFLRPLVRTFWTLDQGKLSVEPATAAHQAPVDETPMMSALHKQLAQRGLSALRHCSLAGGGRLTVFGSRPSQGCPLFEIIDLRVNRGKRAVAGTDLEPFSLSLHEGETALLEAPNGWGKTTLLEAIAGVLPVQAGRITLHRSRLKHATAWQRAAAGLGFLQSRNQVFPALSVRETLQLSHQQSVPDLLASIADRTTNALSGGERQLLALVSQLGNPRFNVRLLDEPFSALDDDNMRAVMARLWPTHGANLIAVPSQHHR